MVKAMRAQLLHSTGPAKSAERLMPGLQPLINRKLLAWLPFPFIHDPVHIVLSRVGLQSLDGCAQRLSKEENAYITPL